MPRSVVGESVPEIAQLGGLQPQPLAGVVRDELVCARRPVGGYFHARERMALGLFGPEDGIVEHPGLVGVQGRRDERITVGQRVVADVEIDAAVRGQEDGFAGGKVVVQCTGGSPDENAAHQQRRRRHAGAHGKRFPCAAQADRRQHERHEEQDVRHHHGHDAHQQAEPEKCQRARPSTLLRAQRPPDHEPERADQVGGRHQHQRVRLRGHAKRPARRRQPADEPAAPRVVPRTHENQRRDAEEQRGRASFEHLLDERHHERLVAARLVNERQVVSVTGQPVERLVVRPHPPGDATRPVAVELHVALVGQNLRRIRRQEQHAHPHEQRPREHDGDRRQATLLYGRRDGLSAHACQGK